MEELIPQAKEGAIRIIMNIIDLSGNSTTDTVFYHLLVSKGKNTNISDYIFNYPNPFSVYEGTTFRYVITNPEIESGTLVIFDAGGDIVYYRELNPNEYSSGIHHEIRWNGKSLYGENLASGIYFGYFEVEYKKQKKVSYLKIAIDNR